MASTTDFCKEVPGSIPDPAPPKIEVYAALDEQPRCRASSKYSDDQSRGSESNKKTKTKYMEERWHSGSAPDCKSVVLDSNLAPPQHTANSVNPEVGSHLVLHSTMCWPLRGGRGTQYTQKTLKIYRKKNIKKFCVKQCPPMLVTNTL